MSEAEAQAGVGAKLSPGARQVAAQWAKLGERWASEGRFERAAQRRAERAEEASVVRERERRVAAPAGGYRELAIKLAEVLEDHGSLRMYEQLVARCDEGRLCPQHGRAYVRRLLMGKARELAAQRTPRGPVRNPAAVFVAWARKLPGAADAE